MSATDSFLQTCNALVTDPIGEIDARFICADWHGGQWSDMYGFSSSGVLTDAHGIAREAEEAYRNATEDAETGDLLALYQWAVGTDQYRAEA